jgi:hypothetical protein
VRETTLIGDWLSEKRNADLRDTWSSAVALISPSLTASGERRFRCLMGKR